MFYSEMQACIDQQKTFFARGHSGCIFAAHAAKQDKEVGWTTTVCSKINTQALQNTLSFYTQHPSVNTIGLVFPAVNEQAHLEQLIQNLMECQNIETSVTKFQRHFCIGFKLKIFGKSSWMSGFGPFSFLPPTRQTPFTGVVVRVKDTPKYDVEIKKTASDTLHVANILLPQMDAKQFKKTGDMTYKTTTKILGHKANLLSAAKTTFAIPENLISINLRERLLA